MTPFTFPAPYVLRGPADPVDVDERREHIEQFLQAVAGHVTALLADLNQHLPVTSTVDSGDFMLGMADLMHDTLSGPLMKAAEQLAEDGMERAYERI
jgi:hypothetical protein